MTADPSMNEPVAWRCFDRIMEQYSVTDSAQHAAGRSSYPDAWTVEPLYSEASILALQKDRDKWAAEAEERANACTGLSSSVVIGDCSSDVLALYTVATSFKSGGYASTAGPHGSPSLPLFET